MRVLSLTVLLLSVSVILHQINNFTNRGVVLIEDGVSYIVESAKTGWKYSLSFVEDSHESKLNKMRKEKEKRDLQRQIRIEEIEGELVESNSIIDKSMPNYNNLLMMFGNELPRQYEVSSQIVMMKGTIFVSESLETLATIVKNETGRKLEEMNMKHFVDKIIDREIYMDTLIMFYEQQLKHQYLVDEYSSPNGDDSPLILNNAIRSYESTWNMNLANTFLGIAQDQSTNLTFIDYSFVSQKSFYETLDYRLSETSNRGDKEEQYKTTSLHINRAGGKNRLLTLDPKCKDEPHNPDKDSVWKKYNKYT